MNVEEIIRKAKSQSSRLSLIYCGIFPPIGTPVSGEDVKKISALISILIKQITIFLLKQIKIYNTYMYTTSMEC